MQIRIRHGLDLPIEGVPERTLEAGAGVNHVALVGPDYHGLEPRMMVQVGDNVTAGQPLFSSKRDADVVFTAPGIGTVIAIHRGARRVLKSVVIELDSDETCFDISSQLAGLSLREQLLRTGLWTAFRTRPYSKVPASNAQPASLFVTAMDTAPLAANPIDIISENATAFEHGLAALSDLVPDGPVFLCTAPDWNGPVGSAQHATFDGPHPAGLPGTHIHHLDPVGADHSVWQIGYQDVIAIGRLVAESVLCFERVVALGGTGFRRPRLVRSRIGAGLHDLCSSELIPGNDDAIALISGSVLGGRLAEDSEAFLGRYHQQVVALPAAPREKTPRWRQSLKRQFSFAGTFTRPSGHGSNVTPFTTDQNGRPTALVPIDAFERLMPLDILAEPLLRALLIGDTDQAQALGALELDEDDLALCSFVCPGKNDYGSVLRANLQQIELEG